MNDLTTLGNQMPGVNAEGRDIAVAGETAREQAMVLASFSVADRRPRSEANAINKLSSSLDRFSFAEKARYAYPRGGTTIEGPSINMAREIARLWGNMQYGVKVIQDDEETRTVSGWAIDLETNTYVANEASFKKLIQRKNKVTKQTEWVTPDERDLRELTNKHGAIAVRNSLLQLFPRDIVDGAMKQAKSTIAKGVKAGTFDTQALIKAFKKMGVSGEQIEEYCGCPLTQISAEQFAELRGVYESISAGQASKEEFFGKEEAESGYSMPQETKKKPAPAASISGMKKAAKAAGISESELTEFCKEQFNVKSVDEVSAEDLGKVSEWIEFNKSDTSEETKEGELL